MRIENKIGNGEIEFGRVPNGEVFLHDGEYYLAINTLEDDCGDRMNAIDLSEGHGMGCYFDDDDMVLVVKATLTIESL